MLNPFRTPPLPSYPHGSLGTTAGQPRKWPSYLDNRAFDRLPILADALEDAGCTDADILNHCRSGGLRG